MGGHVAYNPTANEYLVVFQQFAPPWSVVAQRLGADGTEIGASDFVIGTTVFGAAGNAAVAYNPDQDEYLVVFDAEKFTDDEIEIFGQRIDATTGAEVGADDFRVSDMGPDLQENWYTPDSARVVYNSAAGEYLVVWVSADATPFEREIFGQRIDAATGAEVGVNDFQISRMGDDGDDEHEVVAPGVAYNPVDDNYLVAWGSELLTPRARLIHEPFVLEFEVFGQYLRGSDAAEIGLDDFRLSDMGPDGFNEYRGWYPDVAFAATPGEFFAVWQGEDNTAPLIAFESEVFGQRLAGEGLDIPVTVKALGGVPMLPAAGGPVDWRLTVTNETPVMQSLQLWAEITLEGKRTVGPVLGPKDITLQAGQSVEREMSLNIASNVPPGTHTLLVRIGTFGESIVATDSLIFVKDP